MGAAATLSERLYARHRRMVLGLCRGLLRDPVEAEDAAQQTFLSAHRALLNGAEPREAAAWLATIARNECWARTSARMREPLTTDAVEDVAATHDPVQEATRRADLQALWLAIKQLPRQQRDALLLREFGGLRYDELAVALGVSEPSVESLLFRARTRLRSQLKAAYAALTGASWLESLARLLAGGGAPAVATKAVALTLGTAAVTGGAVVAPDLLEHRTHTQPPAQTRANDVHHVAAPRLLKRVEAVAAPPRVVVRPYTTTRHVETREHETEHAVSVQSGEGEHRTTTQRDPSSPSHEGPGPGGGDDATAGVTTVTVSADHQGGGGDDGRSGRDGGSDGVDGGGGSDGPG